MTIVDTKYGVAVACKLADHVTGGTVNVFLPRYIKMSAEEVSNYNIGAVPPVSLIFRGKANGRFIIDFE